MIPVQLQPEPPDFDLLVRQPGTAWLKKHSISPSIPRAKGAKPKFASRWEKQQDEVWNAYGRVCAYLAIYLDHDEFQIDHFVPKAQKPAGAYEWSNLRLCSARMYARKGVSAILDPCSITQGTFVLSLSSGAIRPGLVLSADVRNLAQYTIDRLKLDSDQHREMRRERFAEYVLGQVSETYLRDKSPFVWFEAKRQNLL